MDSKDMNIDQLFQANMLKDKENRKEGDKHDEEEDGKVDL